MGDTFDIYLRKDILETGKIAAADSITLSYDNAALRLGTGNDAKLSVGTDNSLTLEDVTANADMIFRVHDGTNNRKWLWMDTSVKTAYIGNGPDPEAFKIKTYDDFAMEANNKYFSQGASNQFKQWFDGTNENFNITTGSGIYQFFNKTGLGRIRVKDVIQSTPEDKDYSALKSIVNPNLLRKTGISEEEFHSRFPPQIQTTFEETNSSDCHDVLTETRYCYLAENEELCTTNIAEVPKGISNTEKLIYHQECSTYPVMAISMGDAWMFNYKAIWELKTELCSKDASYSWC